MPTWGAASDVQARVAYAATFSTTTKPTLSQVEAWIDEAESMMRSVLAAQGLATTYSPGTDAARILRSWATDYAEGRVRKTWASNDGSGNRDGDDLVQRFHDNVKMLRERTVQIGGELLAGDTAESTRGALSYVTDNSDGKSISNGDFDPVITSTEVF